MDKEKLIEWIEKRMTENDKKDNFMRVFPHLGYCMGTSSICQILLQAIQNGEFEQEGCEFCGDKEVLDYNKNSPICNYCKNCGRPLGKDAE